ncbi:MAG: hypothetical protein WCQ99_03870 [Pseudomonadota bacterium]
MKLTGIYNALAKSPLQHSQHTVSLLIFIGAVFLQTAAALASERENFSPWEDMGLYGGQILSLAVDPQSPSTVYAGAWGGDGLFISADRGMTWQPLPTASPGWFRNCEISDIAVDPHASSTLWVAGKQKVDVTYDSGITWKSFAMPDDRFPYAVAVDPHDGSGDTVYVGTSGPVGSELYGLVLKTIDGGFTWRTLYTAPYDVLDLQVNPDRKDEVWAVSAPWTETQACIGRILMSPDGGSTWHAWSQGSRPDGSVRPFGYLDEILVNPGNPAAVFAAGDSGVLCTRDASAPGGGWSWSAFIPEETSNALCIPASAPDTLYAGFSSFTVKSADRGATWDAARAAPLFLCMQAAADNADALYGGSVNQGVFTSHDGAGTWQSSTAGIQANTIYATDFSPLRPSAILCGTLAGTYLYTDKKEWALLNEKAAYAVRFHPEKENSLYAGFDRSVGKSSDSGGHWEYRAVSDNPNEHDVASIAVSPGRPDTIFAGLCFSAGDRGEVVKIIDNSTDFSAASAQTLFVADVPVNTVALHPQNPDIIYAGTGWFYAPGLPGDLYISRNGGRAWKKTALQKVTVNSIALAPSNPDLIYAACGDSGNYYSGIYKSTDGGITWENKTGGLPFYFCASSIHIDKDDPDIAYVALYKALTKDNVPLGGIYLTLDGGNYWTHLGLSEYALHDVNSAAHQPVQRASEISSNKKGALPLPAGSIIAGTESGLYAATTAGAGILTGSITSQKTGLPIDGALVSTAYGSHSLSVDGWYLLLLPEGIHSLQVQSPGYIQASASSAAVAAGESREQNFTLAPVGQDNGTLCLASLLLDGTPHHSRLGLLRAFRDRVLAKTPLGKRLASFYYTHGKEIGLIAQHNPRLQQRCLKLLTAAIPAVEKSLAGTQQNPGSELFNEASCLLYDIEQSASQNLRNEINRIRRTIRLTDIEAMLNR